jgi:hypothetical protein
MNAADERLVADDEGDRPWEQPGGRRRDAEPHRGELLVMLAHLSQVCGLGSLFVGAPALVGLPLAFAVRRAAGRDVAGMAAGRLDPRGQATTQHARDLATRGLVLNGGGCLLGLLYLLMWWAG